MTVEQALEKYTEAASAAMLKGKLVRNGNWESLARALRHFKPDAAIIEEKESDGVETALLVTPPKVEPPLWQRPPFYLLVTR